MVLSAPIVGSVVALRIIAYEMYIVVSKPFI